MNNNRLSVSHAIRLLVWAMCAVLLALLASGCGGAGMGLSGGTDQTFARIYGGPIPVTLINDSGRNACYIHISPAGSYTAGDDWLGPTEIVYAASSRTFYVAANGVWDFRIDTCGQGEIAEAHGVRISGPTQLAMASLSAVMAPVPSGGEAMSTVPTVPTVPTVQNNVSTQVVVNGPPTSSDDVVTLRDGTLLRGRVAELHPGQGVTLVLLTGITRAVPWAELASVSGPSFPQRVQ